MIVTIRVEYEGRKIEDDLGVEEKLTIDQIDSCKFDLVCSTLQKLRGFIDQALKEKSHP